MKVDLQSRAKLAESARWLVGARITNHQFEESVPKSKDPAVWEIYNQFFWPLYCDFREHRLAGPDQLSQVQRATAARCILFLKSGLPYPWPVHSRIQYALLMLGNLVTLGFAGRIYHRRLNAAGDVAYWPFISESQYTTALGAPMYLSGTGANNSFKPTPLRGAA